MMRSPVTGFGTACRTSLVALLSWLGLPLCSEAQATPDTEPQNAGARAEASGIDKVLRRLDTAFGKADAKAYLAIFEPDHPGTHALLSRRLHRLFARNAQANTLQRTSTIIAGPRQVGPRTVVRVRHQIHRDGKKLAIDIEDSVMAFRTDGTNDPVPTFVIDTPRAIDCPAGDLFRCPPCNYEIGGIDGWLCVPMGRDRSQSLEASSFYLLGTDLACDVSVRIDNSAASPIALIEDLAAILRQVEPGAEAKLATSWLPPSRAAEALPDLAGARIEIGLPASDDTPGGSVALFHVVQLGSLQHLLLVRGSKKAAREHHESLEDLLASFRVIDANTERAVAGARALKFHVGGTIEGSTYDNRKFGVTMTGPEDWTTQQRCGGAAFRVVWTAPSGARLWLTAWAVPPGMAYWCDETANHWVQELCKAAGLSLPEKVADWQPAGVCDATARTVTCSMDQSSEGGAIPGKSKRVLRIAFREDLLIIADGSAVSAEDWQAVRAAFATLRL